MIYSVRRKYHKNGGGFSMKRIGEVDAATAREAIEKAIQTWPKIAQQAMKDHGFVATIKKDKEPPVIVPAAPPPPAPKLADRVRDFFKSGGVGSADHVATRLKLPVLTVRPRVSELRRAGLIEETERRARTREGHTCAEWKWKGEANASE